MEVESSFKVGGVRRLQWYKHISENRSLNIMIFFSFFIVLVSFYSKSFLLFAFGISFIFFGLASRWYLTHIANDLLIENQKQKIKLFPDEKGEIKLKARQYGKVPILSSTLHLLLDRIVDCSPYNKPDSKQLLEVRIPLSLAAREEIELNIPIKAVKRGFTRIRGLELTIEHPFGFGQARMEYSYGLNTEIIIFPTPIAVVGIQQITPNRQGEFSNRHSVFENTITQIGTRNYISSDPFNRIHWKATAKTSNLQTMIYDRTSQFAWTILLNIQEDNGIYSNLENVLSHVTYLCHYAIKRNIQFELLVNIRSAGNVPFFYLSLGNGTDQLEKALEMLARVSQHSVLIPFKKVVYYLDKHHTLAPYVIVCGAKHEDEAILLKDTMKRGSFIYRLVDEGELGTLTRLNRNSTVVVEEAL